VRDIPVTGVNISCMVANRILRTPVRQLRGATD
jgi:hypothetical protein